MSASPTVVEALSAVMADVQAVGKDDRNTQQNYSFRGVDAVMNAVGPALREHGVVVVPTGVEYTDEQYQSRQGARMRGVTMTVSFRFYGPAGDYIDAAACGEAADSGDKAIPKAHSVAFRTLLLQALCIPTGDPDPDAETHERAGREAARRETARRDDPHSRFERPKDWKSLAVFFEEQAATPLEPWLLEAVEKLYGAASVRDLDDEQKVELFRGTFAAACAIAIAGPGPGGLPPVPYEDIQLAFYEHLGVALVGPKGHPGAAESDGKAEPEPEAQEAATTTENGGGD